MRVIDWIWGAGRPILLGRGRPRREIDRYRAVSHGVLCLMGGLARADGPLNTAELAAIRDVLELTQPEVALVARRLADQPADREQALDAARALAGLFGGEPQTLAALMTRLLDIAEADPPLSRIESNYLSEIQSIFDAGAVAARTFGSDPYRALGVRRNSSSEDIRTAWRGLIRELHPDATWKADEDRQAIARRSEALARVNAAYDRIRQERGLP